MSRALLALLLILGHLPVAAGPRRRAVQHPAGPVAPEALTTAARQAAEIGSITKQFTAAAILRLAERGALSIDDRIEKFVPEFDPRGRTVTLRQLMQHRSGLPRDWYKPGEPFPYDRYFSVITRQQVIAGINAQPFDFAPGTTWSYSNAGYMLLGYAIESITGTEYAEFFHSEFALPLGLIDTGVCGTFNLPRPDGYGLFGGNAVRLTAVHPSSLISSGSLCSTASDLTRWAHLLATGGVMLPASYAKMTTPVSPFVRYGFGLELYNILGQPAVSITAPSMAASVISIIFPSGTSPLPSSRMPGPSRQTTRKSSRTPWRAPRSARCSDPLHLAHCGVANLRRRDPGMIAGLSTPRPGGGITGDVGTGAGADRILIRPGRSMH
jgi:CubicO group peptidase (beta-lactamase class C family)